MEENQTIETVVEETTKKEEKSDVISRSELDSEVSKSVDKALTNARSKWERELQQKLEEAKKEGAAYALMNEEEKQNTELAKKEKALLEREKELNDRELLSTIKSQLQEEKLSVDIADELLVIGDQEKIANLISNINKTIDERVSAIVKENARQESPAESAILNEVPADEVQKRINKYKK